MATYTTLVARPEHTPYWYITIAGIPVFFGTYEGLTLAGYTYKQYLMAASISEQPETWDIKSGKGTPGSLRLSLTNPDGDFLTSLFATGLSTMKVTRITEDMAYSDSAGEHIHVADTTGWPGAGDAYRGLETVTYTGTTATTLTGVQRGAYGSFGTRHKIVSATEPESKRNPVITTHPTVWQGRWLSLYHGLVDEHGGLAPAQLAWRGILQEPSWSDDGLSIELMALGLMSLLDRSLCQDQEATETHPHVDPGGFYYLDETVNVVLEYYETGATAPHVIVAQALGGTWNPFSCDNDLDIMTGCKSFRDDHGINISAFIAATEDGSRVVIRNRAKVAGVEINISRMLLPQYMAEALGFASSILVNLGYGEDVTAENAPALSYHGTATRKIYVSSLDPISVPTLPTGVNNCYLITCDKGQGPSSEVVQVTATGSDVSGSYIEVSQRGVGIEGNKGQALWCSAENGNPIIRKCLYMQNVSAITCLRYMMLSCGGAAWNSDYDALPEGVGAAIPEDFLLTASWERHTEAGQLRRYLLADPIPLWDIVAAECAYLGMRIFTAQGLLGITPIGGVAASEAIRTLSEVHLGDSCPPPRQDASMQIGAVRLAYNHDLSTDEFLTKDVLFQSVDALSFQLPASEISIDHKGLRSFDARPPEIERAMDDLLARFSSPPHSIELEVPYGLAYNIRPGHTILLTHNAIINPYSGSRGMDAGKLAVIGVSTDWKAYTRTLSCLLPRLETTTGAIAPSAQVASFTAHAGLEDEVELEPSQFSSDDLDGFAIGMKVRILDHTDESKFYEGVITDINQLTRTLYFTNPVLIDGGVPVAGDLVRYVDAADVALTTDQLLRVALAAYATEMIAGSRAAFLFG